jgi:hypothetical protein
VSAAIVVFGTAVVDVAWLRLCRFLTAVSRLFLCPEGVVVMETVVVFIVELLLTSGVVETITQGNLLRLAIIYGIYI